MPPRPLTCASPAALVPLMIALSPPCSAEWMRQSSGSRPTNRLAPASFSPYWLGGAMGRIAPSGPASVAMCVGDPLGERRIARAVGRGAGVLRVPQLDRLDVRGRGFGVDDEHAPARIALALRGEERRGELHLAGPRLRVVRGVPGEQCLRFGEALADRVGDRRELADLALVEPGGNALSAQRLYQRQDALAVAAAIADEDVGGHRVELPV